MLYSQATSFVAVGYSAASASPFARHFRARDQSAPPATFARNCRMVISGINVPNASKGNTALSTTAPARLDPFARSA